MPPTAESSPEDGSARQDSRRRKASSPPYDDNYAGSGFSPEYPRRQQEETGRRRQQQPASAEDKKRGKRLFGGLMGTLSRTDADNSRQKRRQEIERRQQERLKRQRLEDDEMRSERLARLGRVRRDEHDDRAVEYYLPRKLTREQERIIDDQLRDARDLIRRERWDRGDEKHAVGEGSNQEHGGDSVVSPADHHDDVVLEADEDTLIY
ncbi:pinin/SDK/memA/ protein conserved region [Geosmithia morbida]|uniref:Pinin/SDK/memA/ protein conserved region n=1 Tax=Geosmithia morbida TaxID=1094350 RepID=A0A9P4YT52_9HYPO|nr:pinin/SDK/memA/ protein conserved region [Geosmithia morbida]KAF4121314.1 pinin/SDK/memA/ protein conserved region [Geosmithia morbida]